MTNTVAILRLPAVKARVGLSRSTIYQYISEGRFPAQIRLGTRAVGWPEREISAVNAARIAGKSDDQIRVLVAELVAARKPAV
jgi:prophage regulatory protein